MGRRRRRRRRKKKSWNCLFKPLKGETEFSSERNFSSYLNENTNLLIMEFITAMRLQENYRCIC